MSGDENDSLNATIRQPQETDANQPNVPQAGPSGHSGSTQTDPLQVILLKLASMEARMCRMEAVQQPPSSTANQQATNPVLPSMPPLVIPSNPIESSTQQLAVSNQAQVSLDSQSGQSTPSQTTSQSAFVGHKKLLDLPSFCGRTEDWPLFISSFKMSTLKYGYDDIDNAFRLQKCLSGRAKEEVSNMLSNTIDVPAAIATLELLFGQPIMVVRCAVAKAKAISRMNADRLEEWAPFAAKIRNLASAVDTPTTQEYNRNPMMLDELVQKLPPADRLRWSDYAEAIQPSPSIKDFAEWTTRMAKRAALVVTQSLETTPAHNHRRSQMCDRRPGKSNLLLISNPKRDAHSVVKTTHRWTA